MIPLLFAQTADRTVPFHGLTFRVPTNFVIDDSRERPRIRIRVSENGTAALVAIRLRPWRADDPTPGASLVRTLRKRHPGARISVAAPRSPLGWAGAEARDGTGKLLGQLLATTRGGWWYALDLRSPATPDGRRLQAIGLAAKERRKG